MVGILAAGALWLVQEKLMYFPRRYDAGTLTLLSSERGATMTWQTSDGKQTAFVLPPRIGEIATAPVWVLFAGNGSLALDWVDDLDFPERRVTLVLVDYPGYGQSEGEPRLATIRRALDGFLPALAQRLGVGLSDLAPRLNTAGHSLGAAVALEFVRRQAVREIVLISPFTSMSDMARRDVGWPLCEVLVERWDNRASLDLIAGRLPRPVLTILHGVKDDLIPVAMGLELSTRPRGWAAFLPFPSAGHETIVPLACAELRKRMRPE